MQLREATPQDWVRIYPFFSQIVEAGETYAFPLGLGPDEARAWWMEEPPGLTVVAVDGEEVLGSAKMGPNRPGRGAHVATASFMVDPARRRLGVGRALGEYVVE
jgi:GNAT superfamily N-acetyltransferase